MEWGTEIFVSGRQHKVPGDVVGYKQIVDIWNKLHEAEGKYIEGTPGIDYENDAKGESDVLLPNETIQVKDGTSFSVDPRACLLTDDRLSAFGRRFGFFVTAGPDLLEAENVPCLLKGWRRWFLHYHSILRSRDRQIE